MADVKISQLPVATAVSATDVGPIVHGGITVKATASQLTTAALNATPVTVGQGGTGLSSYTLGDTLYASGTTTLSKLAGNTTTQIKFLQQTGTGSASAAPNWAVISPSSINTQYGAFHYDQQTTLNGTINSSVATIVVTSTTGFSTSGALIIGNEIISYTGKTGTSFTGCTRGVAGSQAASHTTGVGIGSAQIAAANTPSLVEINTTDLTNGVTLNQSTQELTVAITGVYSVAYSIQITSFHNAQSISEFWLKKNGTNLALSALFVTTPARENNSTPGASVAANTLFLSLTAGDKVTFHWQNPNGEISLVTYPSTATYPAAPALNISISQVS